MVLNDNKPNAIRFGIILTNINTVNISCISETVTGISAFSHSCSISGSLGFPSQIMNYLHFLVINKSATQFTPMKSCDER